MLRLLSTSFALIVIGCTIYDADPRTPSGAIDAMASALQSQDSSALFRLIDQRARHAMASVVADRQRAKLLIEADYPQPERSQWLQRLGDAGRVKDAKALFLLRCQQSCRSDLSALVGAPVSERMQKHPKGDVTVIRTARDTTLHMYTGTDGWFGLVWHTQELAEERTRAARELQQIRDNAAVYRRRKQLSQGLNATGSGAAEPPEKAAPGTGSAPSL